MSPTEQQVRSEVRAWLERNWDPQLPLREWRERLAESGWACPTWPRQHFGRGLPPDLALAANEELRRAGAVGPAIGVGMALAAPTLLEHANADLNGRLLRPIITGQHAWCQLFSEPGSGSDLAGLSTHATRDGDEWVVNGQKVWTTGAHHAAYGLLLVRTDPDVPKHRGISYFAFPMQQDGVEVRPLRQMNQRSSFNEVFLSDALVPHANLVGELHRGWPVALTTLAHERGLAGAIFGALPPTTDGRTAQEAMAEARDYLKTYEWYPQRAGRADLVPSAARDLGRNDEPVLRQQIAHLHTLESVARWTAQRARAAHRQGRPPGPEGSIAKLCGSEIARHANRAHTQIAGAAGMLNGQDGPGHDGVIAEVLVSTPAQSIAGGTDEIQHNIIGERVLGLPKEPPIDADMAYRHLRANG